MDGWKVLISLVMIPMLYIIMYNNIIECSKGLAMSETDDIDTFQS